MDQSGDERLLEHARWLYSDAQEESTKALHATWGLFGIQGVLLALLAAQVRPPLEWPDILQIGALLLLLTGCRFTLDASKPSESNHLSSKYLRHLNRHPQGVTAGDLVNTLLPEVDDTSPLNTLRRATARRLKCIQTSMNFTTAALGAFVLATIINWTQ